MVRCQRVAARGESRRRLYFFFFQAEDGIRDYKVTGVQTCALPISEESVDLKRGHERSLRSMARRMKCRAPLTKSQPGENPTRLQPNEYPRVPLVRSEERRVGKEGRSRWSPYH